MKKKQINIIEEATTIIKTEEPATPKKEEPMKTFTTMKGETFKRHILKVDVDYTDAQRAIIFTHGKTNYKLWFFNKAHKLCLVNSTDLCNGTLVTTVTIDVKGKRTKTKMSLDRFLYLVEIGDFKITNTKFREVYMQPLLG